VSLLRLGNAGLHPQDSVTRSRAGEGGAGLRNGAPRCGPEGDSSVVLLKSSQDIRFESVGLNAVV